MSGYRVRVHGEGGMFGGPVIGPVLPTPMLLSEGYRPVEAYEETPASDQYPPVWRVRDDSYDPPGTVYRRVTVERIPDRWQCEHCGREWVDRDAEGLLGRAGQAYLEHECEGMVR